jgi:protein-glutamine gamma-glutamyltransferase
MKAHPPAESERADALRPLGWVCAAFAGGALLNLDRVPLWAGAAALLLIVWRLAAVRGAIRLPGTVARILLALLLVAVVLVRFRTLNGLTAGTTLLMVMSALKLLETRARRDQFVMVAAGLALLLAACLDRQSLVRVPLYALEAWLSCSALAVVATPSCPARTALGLAGRSLLIAAPLAVLLFLFFPRLPGAFWAIPRGEQAVTGLSDTLSPGSVVKLVSNYEPAFRVQFTAGVPPPEERYWRGPVLHDFDGFTWRHPSGIWHRHPPLEYLGAPYRYRVTLEPSRQRWWFALDTPARSPEPNVFLTYDNQLLATEPVSEPLSFEALSYTHTRALEPLSAYGRRQDIALPARANPRSVALGQALRERAGSDEVFVLAALDYLRTGGFQYSLTPDWLGADAVDDFLFRTREGFCGHYASAFVTLMRAGGVPAHVVTGYLGGEWNPVGGYLLVRQSDAHAWAEVWLEGRGWTRFDPTTVVAPGRLNRGVFDLLPDALAASQRLLRSAWLARWLQGWDAANAWWSDHVVKFDFPAQLELLGRLGIRSPDVRYLGYAFMFALVAWLAFIAWHIGRSVRAAPPDALARAYTRLCEKLANAGAPRAPHQGPLSLAATVSARRPDLPPGVHALLARYAQLRYGPAPGSAAREIEEFAGAVRRLSLPRRAPAFQPLAKREL